MQTTVLLLGGEPGPVALLAQFERCRQYERARHLRLAVERREFDGRHLNVVGISDQNDLPQEVASLRATDPNDNCQRSPGIDLA